MTWLVLVRMESLSTLHEHEESKRVEVADKVFPVLANGDTLREVMTYTDKKMGELQGYRGIYSLQPIEEVSVL